MNDLESAAEGLRTVESANDYRRQQLMNINGEPHRKVGAYGFVESRWDQLSAAAGFPDADWHDPTAQDRVAKQKLQRDFDTFGSWEAAVVAFRFGVDAAQAYADGKAFTQRVDIDSYVDTVKQGIPDMERPVDGTLTRNDEGVKEASLSAAEGVIRDRLVMMRDSQVKNAPPEPEEPEADEKVPEGVYGTADIENEAVTTNG